MADKKSSKRTVKGMQGVRMDDKMRIRIAAYQKHVQQTGLEVTFSSLIRTLIDKGLTKEGY